MEYRQLVTLACAPTWALATNIISQNKNLIAFIYVI